MMNTTSAPHPGESEMQKHASEDLSSLQRFSFGGPPIIYCDEVEDDPSWVKFDCKYCGLKHDIDVNGADGPDFGEWPDSCDCVCEQSPYFKRGFRLYMRPPPEEQTARTYFGDCDMLSELAEAIFEIPFDHPGRPSSTADWLRLWRAFRREPVPPNMPRDEERSLAHTAHWMHLFSAEYGGSYPSPDAPPPRLPQDDLTTLAIREYLDAACGLERQAGTVLRKGPSPERDAMRRYWLMDWRTLTESELAPDVREMLEAVARMTDGAGGSGVEQRCAALAAQIEALPIYAPDAPPDPPTASPTDNPNPSPVTTSSEDEDIKQAIGLWKESKPQMVIKCQNCGKWIDEEKSKIKGRPLRERSGMQWFSLCDECYAKEENRYKPKSARPKRDGPFLLSNSAFIQRFTALDYAIEGWLQRGYFYAMTGRTGAGKTSILQRIAAHKRLGLTLHGRRMDPGRIALFTNEHSDDFHMRWIKLCEDMGIADDDPDIALIEGFLSLSDEDARKQLDAELQAQGPFSLIAIDSSMAYFEGDEQNSSVQMYNHAQQFRRLAQTGNRPTVIATCNPVKNAADDNLLPMGGSTFLNETDGNITARMLSREPLMSEVHWQGKFRGPEWAPMHFLLETGTSPRLVDTKGQPIKTVTAKPATMQETDQAEEKSAQLQMALLQAMHDNPGESLSVLARAAGLMARGDGGAEYPNKQQAGRIANDMVERGYVRKIGIGQKARYGLTTAGRKAAGIVKAGKSEADVAF
jgi:hypothetical protein